MKAKAGKAKVVTWVQDKAMFSPKEREIKVPREKSGTASASEGHIGSGDWETWREDIGALDEPTVEAIEAMLAMANSRSGGKVMSAQLM